MVGDYWGMGKDMVGDRVVGYEVRVVNCVTMVTMVHHVGGDVGSRGGGGPTQSSQRQNNKSLGRKESLASLWSDIDSWD